MPFIALAFIFIRLCVGCIVLALRVIAILFFAPVFKKSAPSTLAFLLKWVAGGCKIQVVHEDEVRPQTRGNAPARQAVATPAPPKPAPVETQNHKDLIIALTGLGWPKAKSAEIAQGAVDKFGGDAPLNTLLNYALQSQAKAK